MSKPSINKSGISKSGISKSGIEDQLAVLRELQTSGSSLDKEVVIERVRPFVKHANNLLVARAADLAAELELRPLVEDLVAAFHRFLENPAKKDPQCWAKNSLSKALHRLGYDNSQLYLAGMRLHQYEPVWGGQSDVAGTLRANCAHALIDCHELTHQALLLHLLEVVADADKSVRAEAIRAITQAGGDSAVLLLRMRALTAPADEDPSVIGQCYAGLLALEGVSAVPFVAQFLANQDDLSAEAAVALGETRTPEALKALLQRLHPSPAIVEESGTSRRSRRGGRDAFLEPAFAAALLSSIALTRQPEAITTLLQLVEEHSSYAEAAIEALANAAYGDEVRQQLEVSVDKVDSHRISLTYKRHFSS
jgi:hypothetical protein